MCGIAGIIGRLDNLNRSALERMSDAMVHRGPDASGTWVSAPDSRGWGALLAHRRLSILDLSPAGAQPMVDPVTGHVIVFNGEIYNFRDLRGRLVAEGQELRSTGDTAVMLRALGLHGPEAVGWLRGMFTFACWDPKERRLLLARDPLGIKPLYLARSSDPAAGWSLAFASELRALLASGLLGSPRLDPQAVASSVWNGFVIGPGTAVKGVDLLWPGRLLEFDGEGKEVRQRDFWRIPDGAPDPITDEDSLAATLEEGLRLHLASDVPLAVLLSSGVDSSVTANLAQRAAESPIHTFTLAFEEHELNEGPIARRIAAAIGTQHHEVVLTEARVVEDLEAALDSLDQPTFDGLNAYYISRAIRAAGFTVALSGAGGDELFGGYTSYRDLPMLHRWSRRAMWAPRSLQVAAARLATWPLRRSGGTVPPQTRWAKLPEMVRHGDDLLALYQLAYALFLPGFQHELLASTFAETLADGLPVAMRQRIIAESRGRTPLSAISVMEQRLFLGERLLRDNDVASMACSLEQRVPLVDQVLFESVDRLPDHARYWPLGKKAMLRRIGLRGLDPGLFERPKSGFVLPFDRWIRRGLKDAMDQTLRDPQAIAPVGLDPVAVERLWRAFLDGRPACIGRGFGRYTSSSDGATAIAFSDEAAVPDAPKVFPPVSPERLNILYVSPMPASPPRFGAQARMHGLMTRLGRRHDLTAAVLIDDEFDADECRRAMQAYCREVVMVPNPYGRKGLAKRLLQVRSLASTRSFERLRVTLPELQQTLDRVLRAKRFDVVNLEFPDLGHYDLRQAPPGERLPRLVVDSHEIAHDLARQFARAGGNLGRRLYAGANWRKLRREELETYREADGVCLCSAADERRLLNQAPRVRTAVIPNAADVEYYQPRSMDPRPDGRTVVYFGLLSTVPNIDGVIHFVQDIWPRIAAAHPEAQFKIIGGRPPPPLLALAGPRVELTGFVPDLRPHLAAAAAVVAPLRLGGGTRLKIVEAMAMGKAIVSTTLGAEGIEAVPGRDLLVEDQPAAFAEAVGRLLAEPGLAARIGQSARKLAVERYAWSGAAGALEEFYRLIMESTA